ncbi:hypothetical protein [Longitalea luteola]|uniref:hypothetical protein n=1 Tax=Longitalea luteola TaxID=2812563 RepID=UPI001A96CEDD|nr:hypothetical protein [Longitalea luteola]
MKTISPLTAVLQTIIVTALAFSACKKQDDASSGPAGREEFAAIASVADARAEVVFDDVFNNVMGVSTEVGIGGTGIFGRIEGTDTTTCYTVITKQLNNNTRFPLNITIDFGSGCVGRDGRVRKGRINIVYTGHLFISGNSATTVFEGYYLDDLKVEGTYTLTNAGTPDKKSYTSRVSNARLSTSNGNYIQWNSEKTVTQTEGGATLLLGLDDVYTLTGLANGAAQINNKYFQWSTAVNTPLIKRFNCRWISRGTLALKKGNDAVAVLDYGSGTCENKASFSVNGQVKEITLH